MLSCPGGKYLLLGNILFPVHYFTLQSSCVITMLYWHKFTKRRENKNSRRSFSAKIGKEKTKGKTSLTMDGQRGGGITQRRARWERKEEGRYFSIRDDFCLPWSLGATDTHIALPCNYISTDRKYRSNKKIPGKKKIVPISFSPFMIYVARI